MHRALSLGLVSALVVAGALLVVPRSASACGGFFCSRTPIDQSGENIVFAVEEDGTVTTHVQILYSGAAEQFAWILPVPSLPSLATGTDTLFQALGVQTAPQFQTTYSMTGTCRSEPACFYSHDRAAGIPGAGAPDGTIANADAGAGGVSVYFRGGVGPYDAAILTSGDAMALRTWLTDNGYDIPAAAAALLDYYVSQGDFFVALRLQQDRGVGEIQPIVLKYVEAEPCIPIRLTAIATVPNMPITAFVLASARAVPANYMPITPDFEVSDLYVPYYSATRTYSDVVTQAVDDAGGHAWVTEFAGAPPAISIEIASIEDLRATTDVKAFLNGLLSRGFMGDAQLLALLQRFVPPPAGVDPTSFYNCLVQGSCNTFDAYLATLAFDPNAFVDALDTAIVVPRREAQAMVARHAKLTRLFTTMSAEEMTEDPVFTLAPTSRDVSNVHTAELITQCSSEYLQYQAPQVLRFPSGRTVRVFEGVKFTGTDAEYCGATGGTLHPGSEVGGGGCGLCAARPAGHAEGGAVAVAALCLLAWARGRRRANRARS